MIAADLPVGVIFTYHETDWKEMKKIDAHIHINFNGLNAGNIIHYLDGNGIDKCWLHTWEEMNPPVPSLYRHIRAEDVMEAYNRYPERIVPFYAPDPGSTTWKTDLEYFVNLGLKGCGELKIALKWEDQLLADYLKVVTSHNLPLLFHMEAPGLYYMPDRRSLVEKGLKYLMNGAFNGTAAYYINIITKKTSLFAGRLSRNSHKVPGYLYDFGFLEKRIVQFPNVIFIGHGPHFWNNIAADISLRYRYQRGPVKDFGIIDLLLEQYDNFYCDISGRSGYYALHRDAGQTKRFLEKHANKILYGTDNIKEGKMEKLLLSFGLSRETLYQIFYDNANRIIG